MKMLRTLMLGAAALSLVSAPTAGLAYDGSANAYDHQPAPKSLAAEARQDAHAAKVEAHHARKMARRAHRKARRAIDRAALAEKKSLDAREGR